MLKHFYLINGLTQAFLLLLISLGGLASSRSAVTYGLFGFVISLGLTAVVSHFSGDGK